MKKTNLLMTLSCVFAFLTGTADSVEVTRRKIELGFAGISYSERLTTDVMGQVGYYLRDDNYDPATWTRFFVKSPASWSFSRSAMDEAHLIMIYNLLKKKSGNISRDPLGFTFSGWSGKGDEETSLKKIMESLDVFFAFQPTDAELQESIDSFKAEIADILKRDQWLFVTGELHHLLYEYCPLTEFIEVDFSKVTVASLRSYFDSLRSKGMRSMIGGFTMSRFLDQDRFAKFFGDLLNKYEFTMNTGASVKPKFGFRKTNYVWTKHHSKSKEDIMLLTQNFNTSRDVSAILTGLFKMFAPVAVDQVFGLQSSKEATIGFMRGTSNANIKVWSSIAKFGTPAELSNKMLEVFVSIWNRIIDTVKTGTLQLSEVEKKTLKTIVLDERVGATPDRGTIATFLSRTLLGRVEQVPGIKAILNGSMSEMQLKLMAQYVAALKEGLGAQIAIFTPPQE